MAPCFPLVAALFACVLVSSCAPVSREANPVTVAPLDKGGSRFLISVEAGNRDSPAWLGVLALRRSAEVAAAHHFRYFTVLHEHDMAATALIAPANRNAAGNVNGFGGTAGMPISANPNGLVIHPGRILIIQCSSVRPRRDSAAVHDVEEFQGR